MIRHDETTPVRSRRRMMYLDRPFDSSSRQRFPHGTDTVLIMDDEPFF